MKEHELKVRSKSAGTTHIVNKQHYHDNAADLEVLEGEPGEPKIQLFKQDKKPVKNKMDTKPVDDKAPPPAPAKLTPPAIPGAKD